MWQNQVQQSRELLRLRQNNRTGIKSSVCSSEAQPIAEVKGALDPNQADILSAYSSEQGKPTLTERFLSCVLQLKSSIKQDIARWRAACC